VIAVWYCKLCASGEVAKALVAVDSSVPCDSCCSHFCSRVLTSTSKSNRCKANTNAALCSQTLGSVHAHKDAFELL
jgi:hypothetical protein